MHNKGWLRAVEAAKIIGCTAAWVRLRMHAGVWPGRYRAIVQTNREYGIWEMRRTDAEKIAREICPLGRPRLGQSMMDARGNQEKRDGDIRQSTRAQVQRKGRMAGAAKKRHRR